MRIDADNTWHQIDDNLSRWASSLLRTIKSLNVRRTKFQNLTDSRPVLQLSAQSIEAMYEVENEDVVGAAPTGNAPTTSEWSTI